eukprot:scaffold1866_cov277-Pinguiococcus_pyrenoidosus.AAC.16
MSVWTRSRLRECACLVSSTDSARGSTSIAAKRFSSRWSRRSIRCSNRTSAKVAVNPPVLHIHPFGSTCTTCVTKLSEGSGDPGVANVLSGFRGAIVYSACSSPRT